MITSQLSSIWNNILRELEEDLSPPTFHTWFKSTELIAYYDDYLIISVPNVYVKNWLKQQYFDLIKEKLINQFNRPVNLKFVISEQKRQTLEEIKQNILPKKINNQENLKEAKLNPRYTFDTFVIGNSNRFAHAASRPLLNLLLRPIILYLYMEE